VARAVEKALERLVAEGREPPACAPVVDSSALFAAGGGGRKLGLGSSAAVTVAAHGAVLAAAGLPLDEKRQAIFRACDAAHAEAQGQRGSGADVAAAVWGGVLAFQRPRDEESPGGPLVVALAWPAHLAAILVDTGAAASTGDRVARWRTLAQRRPAVHGALLDRMRALAAVVHATLATSAESIVELVGRWNGALDELERLIDLPIRTPAHRRADELARAHGGAAKPSGAGGGDLAICFCPPDSAAALRARLEQEGLPPLPIALGGPGLSVVPQGEPR
jgi:ERG8-type phosphomevalonate kinase